MEALLIKRRKPGLMAEKGHGVKSTPPSDLPGECRDPDGKALRLTLEALSRSGHSHRHEIWAPAFAGEIGLRVDQAMPR